VFSPFPVGAGRRATFFVELFLAAMIGTSRAGSSFRTPDSTHFTALERLCKTNED